MSTREVIGALPISVPLFTDRVRDRRATGVKRPITQPRRQGGMALAARVLLVVCDGTQSEEAALSPASLTTLGSGAKSSAAPYFCPIVRQYLANCCRKPF